MYVVPPKEVMTLSYNPDVNQSPHPHEVNELKRYYGVGRAASGAPPSRRRSFQRGKTIMQVARSFPASTSDLISGNYKRRDTDIDKWQINVAGNARRR